MSENTLIIIAHFREAGGGGGTVPLCTISKYMPSSCDAMRAGIVFGSSAYITKQINLEQDGKREVITPGRRPAYVISRLVTASTLIGNREVGA